MQISGRNHNDQEPIGIVISRGTRDETTPLFRAYVWGPAPEIGTEPVKSKAA